MKFKYLFLAGLFLVLANIIGGCTNEPVTMATSADGVEISFSNQGKGDASILLVHGWTNDHTIWEFQVPFLLEKFQVVAIDLAGHGKSGNNREKWSMSSFGKDIAAVINAADLNNVILVGFSMGGPAILEAAKLLPDQISGLILADAIHNPEEQVPPQAFPWIDSSYMDLVENPTAEKLLKFGFFLDIQEGAVEKLEAMLDRDQTGWDEMLFENLRWSNEDCTDALKAVNVPVLAINSDMKPTEVEVFKKYVPSFEAKILTGTGHVMMWEIKDDFNQALEESIQKILATK